jgi:hypothetical protein
MEDLDRFAQPGFQEPLIILIEESRLIYVVKFRGNTAHKLKPPSWGGFSFVG